MARSNKLVRPELFQDAAYASLRRLLWYAFVAVNRQVLEELGETPLLSSHITALRNMDRDGTRITVMADRAGVSKQAMGSVVKELSEMGYVLVADDPSDRRAKRVTYTPEGHALVERFIEADRKVESALDKKLGREESLRLKAILKDLILQHSD